MAGSVESIIGVIKAIGDIPKVETGYIQFQNLSEERQQQNLNANTLPPADIKKMAAGVLKTGLNVAGSISSSGAMGILGSALGMAGAKYLEKDKDGFFDPSNPTIMKVQYNPSTISVETEMGDVEKVTAIPSEDKEKSSDAQHESLVRPVNENFRVSLFMAARADNDPSVRIRCETFMNAAALGSGIVFHWGTMNVMGILTEANVDYTMFSPEGEPIEAKVDITIQDSWTEKVVSKEITKAQKEAEKQISKEKKDAEKASSVTEKVTGKFM